MEGTGKDKMTALVTGSGRGLGRQYAERLAKMGYNLILVGKSDSVIRAAEEIVSSHPQIEVIPIVLDLSGNDAAQTLFDMVKDRGINVDVLINNAGIFSFRDILEVPEQKITDMLTLHNLTLTRLCKLFAEDMAARGGGHILNMSSYSIWMPYPGLALYSASKAYIKAFTIAFSKEVREKNIYVTAICPAGIATDFYGLSRKLQEFGVRTGVLMTPEKCAARSLRALWHHRRCAVPDWWNIFFIPILKHLPDWAENLLRNKTMKYQK